MRRCAFITLGEMQTVLSRTSDPRSLLLEACRRRTGTCGTDWQSFPEWYTAPGVAPPPLPSQLPRWVSQMESSPELHASYLVGATVPSAPQKHLTRSLRNRGQARISKSRLSGARTPQVLGISAFRKPSVDRSYQLSSLIKPFPCQPKLRQASGRSQLQRLCVLTTRHVNGFFET